LRCASETIIGASPEQMSYCRNRAEELGIERHVEVVPRVSGNAIPSLIATADLGVRIWEDRTHWRFNPPTKLFEYLVAGLPVLASDIRTHSQYVTDWSNGLIFRYSAASFAEKIVELWARRAELTSLRRNAANSGAEYLWERIEPKFLGAVSSIAGCGARDD
jgi:glycosyltransferase involved in cell wall biosynthesis